MVVQMEYGEIAMSRGRAEVRDKSVVASEKAEQRWNHVPEGKSEGGNEWKEVKESPQRRGGRSTRERTSGRVEGEEEEGIRSLGELRKGGAAVE